MPAALAKMLESASAPVMESDMQQQVLGMAGAEPTALPMEFKPGPEQLRQIMPFMIGMMIVGLLIYLFFCFCLRLIVRKTGTEAGFLIWLPILQLIPMLRAARMSTVWFFMWISPFLVALALPLLVMGSGASEPQTAMGIASILGMATSVLQLVAAVVWCVKIVQARDKHILWAILLILPLTNLIAFLYLAFSSGAEETAMEHEDDSGKIVIQSAFSEA
jgi:apolipoprotein N-acyltransferase